MTTTTTTARGDVAHVRTSEPSGKVT